MQSSSKQPLVGEERYVTTLLTAANETGGPWEIQLSAIVGGDSVIYEYYESGRIPVVSFAIGDNNRSRLEKLSRLDYSWKKFCIFFDRCAEKWPPERQKCKDLSAH